MSSNYIAKQSDNEDLATQTNSKETFIRGADPFQDQYIRPMDNFQKISSQMVNPYACAADAFLQGYTLNYLDEILSSLPALYGAYQGLGNGNALSNAKDYYNRSRSMFRDHLKNCDYREPWRTSSAQILGAFASPAKLKYLGPFAVPTIGAVSGFGASEGGLADHVKGTGIGIGSSWFGNWTGRKGLNYLSKNSNNIANAVTESLYPLTNQNYSPQIARTLTQFSESPIAGDLTSEILGNTLQNYLSDTPED